MLSYKLRSSKKYEMEDWCSWIVKIDTFIGFNRMIVGELSHAAKDLEFVDFL